MQDQLGATDFFDGTMTGPVERKAKVIKIIEDTTFTVLTMQFPANTPVVGPLIPTTVTFPALYELRDVDSFQVGTGVVQVIYAV